MDLITITSFLGFMFCAFASVPQIVKAFRDGHAQGISLWYILALQFGTANMLYATMATTGFTFIFLDYLLSFILFGILFYFRVFKGNNDSR